MPVKPSAPEEEYFAREEAERRRKAAEAREKELREEERVRLRELHHMRCPKCGMQLEEVAFGDVKIDECFHCRGMWLDAGELETIRRKDAGFVGRLLNALKG